MSAAGLCVNMLGGDAVAHGAFGRGETNGSAPSRSSGRVSAVVRSPLGPELPMEAFLVSIASIAVAEMGDRTQLLSLVLAARYRKPWPILGGILVATLANHLAAGALGAWFGRLLTQTTLDVTVGVSLLVMAGWSLKPDHLDGEPGRTGQPSNAFLATLLAFFIAEIGDKTQIATLTLAAAYSNLAAVVAGTTCGMLAANAPVVFLGKLFADRLPLRALNRAAALLFAVLGVIFILRAVR